MLGLVDWIGLDWRSVDSSVWVLYGFCSGAFPESPGLADVCFEMHRRRVD